MAAKISSPDNQKCTHAVGVIKEIISHECQGFILPPSEVRRLLGIPVHYQTWYLHQNVLELRKKLANNFISVTVNPQHGICFTLYNIPKQASMRPQQVN
jgi:hypothetical protein